MELQVLGWAAKTGSLMLFCSESQGVLYVFRTLYLLQTKIIWGSRVERAAGSTWTNKIFLWVPTEESFGRTLRNA